MERLRERLADWYRRRAVLRELIFEAERSDDEEEISAAGGAAGGGVTIQQKQKQKQQRTAGATLAKAVVGGAQPAAAARVPLPLQQHAAARVEGKGAAGSEAQVADGQEGKSINGSGAPQGGLPNGVKVDPMDVVEEVAAAAGGTGTAVGATLASPKQQQQQQQSSGGGVEESKGGEEPGAEAVVPAQERGAVSKEEEAWDVSKRVSATQCKVCNTRGTVTDMVKCIYEGCGGKYHLRCLLPVVDEVRAPDAASAVAAVLISRVDFLSIRSICRVGITAETLVRWCSRGFVLSIPLDEVSVHPPGKSHR